MPAAVKRHHEDPRIVRVLECVLNAMATPSRDETLVGVCMERLIHTKPEAFDGWGDHEVLAVLTAFMQRCPEHQLEEIAEVAANDEAFLAQWEACEAASKPRLLLV